MFLRTATKQVLFLSSRRWRIQRATAISLTLIPGKVMEQILLEATSKNIKNQKVIGSKQQGFMEGRLCPSNLTAFYNELTVMVDERRAMAVTLGFAKLSTLSPITLL